MLCPHQENLLHISVCVIWDQTIKFCYFVLCHGGTNTEDLHDEIHLTSVSPSVVMQSILLTESARRVLLASPTVRMALSTSLWPGRQLTLLFRA